MSANRPRTGPKLLAKAVRFGDYKVHLRIARGGMADVYIATRRMSKNEHQVVAIKRIRQELTEDPIFLRMFRDEARLARYLNHPNIACLLDVGEEAGSIYLVMEFVVGLNIKTLISRGPLPAHLVVDIALGVAEALHAAHEQKDEKGESLNIVHRDVTPMNVMVNSEGEVKLLDFGIAVARGRAEKTQSGVVKGKWSYLSPEQILGNPIDRRVDIFILGTLMYEMLTGYRAFPGERPVPVMRAVTREEPHPLDEFDLDIPQELIEIVEKCMRKERDKRFSTAAELGAELERIAGVRNLVTGAHKHETVAQYMETRFSDRIRAVQMMVNQFAVEPTASSDTVPAAKATPAPALYEEVAGDLQSQSPERRHPSPPFSQPQARLSDASERTKKKTVADQASDSDDSDGDWIVWVSVLIGVVLGAAAAIILWFLV